MVQGGGLQNRYSPVRIRFPPPIPIMRGPLPKPFVVPDHHFWYLVGAIATDGCLSSSGRQVILTSKDRDYLATIREARQWDHWQYIHRYPDQVREVAPQYEACRV